MPLPGLSFIPRFFADTVLTLYDVLDELSLLGNSHIILDAADKNSYPGSGQTFFDISGEDNHFYLGANNSPSTDDPTFVGIAGDGTKDTYFEFDGGDDFQKTSSNTTFINSLHKNNATFTCIGFVYHKSADFQTLFSTQRTAAPGVSLRIQYTGTPVIWVGNTTSGGALVRSADDALPEDEWSMFALSLNENTGSGFFYLNGEYLQVSSSNTFNSTYTSPSSSNAELMAICSFGGVNEFANGARLGAFALLDTALSKSELDDIYTNFFLPRYGS